MTNFRDTTLCNSPNCNYLLITIKKPIKIQNLLTKTTFDLKVEPVTEMEVTVMCM